jgi:hypothetical protein
MPLDGGVYVQNETGQWRVTYTADILGGNFSIARYALNGLGTHPPGVYFRFDVSPISAVTYMDRKPVLHLVTRLLTVVGAVLGICRFVDAAWYASARRKKTDKIEG